VICSANAIARSIRLGPRVTEPGVGSESDLMERARARVGTTIHKYRIDSVLGVGGMAIVYRATHRNRAEFAIKMLLPELSGRADIRNRFLREGYAANTVKHPGVVLVVDDDVADDGAAFLVMELLRGESVEALWNAHGHRLPAAVASAVVDQLLDVLTAAHASGVVHRDIKPANLFVTSEGVVKVLDFGIARVRDVLSGGATGTSTGALLGTPAFMAPEQAKGLTHAIDAQTDLWAVGATFFTLLTGQFVHQAENAALLVISTATTPARPLSSVAPNVAPRIAAIVDRALAFEKAQRWTSAAEMRAALREVSVAEYGSVSSRERLAKFLSEARSWTDETEAAQTIANAAREPRKDLVGGTTAQPVSSRAGLATPPLKRSTWPIWLGASVVSAGLVAGIVATIVSHAQSTVPSAATTGGVASTPTAGSQTSVPSASVPSIPIDELPTASTRTSAPATHATARSHPSATSVTPAASACNPPFFFDANHTKIFKPECL